MHEPIADDYLLSKDSYHRCKHNQELQHIYVAPMHKCSEFSAVLEVLHSDTANYVLNLYEDK